VDAFGGIKVDGGFFAANGFYGHGGSPLVMVGAKNFEKQSACALQRLGADAAGRVSVILRWYALIWHRTPESGCGFGGTCPRAVCAFRWTEF
jgi:hypothetical protein